MVGSRDEIGVQVNVDVAFCKRGCEYCTRAAGAVMVVWEAMLQADACPTGFAAVGVDTVQLLLAVRHRTLGLLVHFGVVHWVASLSQKNTRCQCK